MNQQTQAEVKTQIQITEKIKKNFFIYLIATISVVAFFIHDFVVDEPQSLTNAVQLHSEAKSKRTEALNKVKEVAKGSVEYESYLLERKATNEAFDNVKQVQKEIKFLGFEDIQQFLGEFGWAFGLLLYSLYNLTRTLARSVIKKNPGPVVLHSVFIFISLYFIVWCFRLTDFSKVTYVAFAVLMTSLITVSTFFSIKKYKQNKLNWVISRLFDYILVDIKDKGFIDAEKKNDFTKSNQKLINEISSKAS